MAWRGRRHKDPRWFVVSLLSGHWTQPGGRKRGTDLVGLIAAVYRTSSAQAAIRLAQWLGVARNG